MYLKQIELMGFKSFTAKTQVNFEPGISCVVGPNGSGKSNISDALRWVLGEQSARSIRGGKLEDVIFSGTQKRRPLGMAEVTITLDNSDGYLPLEQAEVCVTRRAIRGGSSEYFINNQPCRLKDIHELFLDTGIGIDGLSLITQGRINELINAKPDERRILVEEAAGIVKYRDRKREAVRKLAETERHLETIGVVIGELSERIEPLGMEAAKAEEYLVLKDQADKLEIGISVVVLSEAEDRIAALDQKIETIAKDLYQEDSRRLALAAEVEDMRLTISKRDANLSETSRTFYQLQTNREKSEGELKLIQSSKNNALENEQRILAELEGIEKALAEKQTQIEQLQSHIERTTTKIKEQEEYILHGEGGENDIRSHSELLTDQLAQSQEQQNETLAAFNAMAGQLEFKQQLIELNNEAINKLTAEQKDLTEEMKTDADSMAALNKQEEKYKKDRDLQTAKINENEHAALSLGSAVQEAAAEDAELNYQVSSARTKVAMLEEMATMYEGFFPGVKSLMQARSKGNAPSGVIDVISELMEVPAEYQAAVESYLGANVQNVVINSGKEAKACVAYLKKNDFGRATFLPLDILQVRDAADISSALAISGVIGIASQQISCDAKIRPAVDFLLNRVVLAKDMDSAMDAAKALKYRFSVVTLAGDMVNPGASISGGSLKKRNSELLSKKNQLAKAKADSADLESNLAKAQNKLADLRQEIEKTNSQGALMREQLASISGQLGQINQELERLAFAEETRDKRQTAISDEVSGLKDDNQGLNEEIAEIKTEFAQLDKDKEELGARITMLTSKQENLQKKMSGQQDQLTESKVDLASSQQKLYGQNLTLEKFNEEIANLKWKAEDKDADRVAIRKEIETYDQKIIEAEEELRCSGLTYHDLAQELEELKHGHAAQTSSLVELEKQEKESTKKWEELQNENYQLALRRERWLADFENETAKLAERFDMDLAKAREEAGEIGSRTNMRNQLNKLKRDINALGTVNIGVIEEYTEVKERYTFLKNQRDDMLTARIKLDKVIEEMDKIMAGRFKDAYNKLSEAFDQSFRRLFGGGSASLYLSQPDEILETGVEIRVDPPGKKVANYNLLSGGEKALIGIALMFAMLAVRTTPFCVMDEVDAALDEANINKFIHFLEEKANDSQFVMITHRQSTMEAAAVLWGVTMEEEGVSKVVSVRLDEAV